MQIPCTMGNAGSLCGCADWHWHNPGNLVTHALQIEALAGFSAIIDRLGEFSEVVESFALPNQGSGADASGNGSSAHPRIELVDVPTATQHSPADQPLLRLEDVTLRIPDGSRTLVDSLSVEVLFSLSYPLAQGLPMARLQIVTDTTCFRI